MRAVLTVVGKDTVGILAGVSKVCAENNVNINDVTQTVMQDMYCMIMMCDISGIACPFDVFADKMSEVGRSMGLSVNVMHEELFNSMHKI